MIRILATFIMTLGFTAGLCAPAHAYIGPAIAYIGMLFGPIAAIFVAIAMVLFFPIRSYLKKRKKKKNAAASEDQTNRDSKE